MNGTNGEAIEVIMKTAMIYADKMEASLYECIGQPCMIKMYEDCESEFCLRFDKFLPSFFWIVESRFLFLKKNSCEFYFNIYFYIHTYNTLCKGCI